MVQPNSAQPAGKTLKWKILRLIAPRKNIFASFLCETIFRQTIYLTPENSAEFGLKVEEKYSRDMASKG